MTLHEFGQAQRLSFPGIEGLNVEIKEVSPNRFEEPLFALFATWKNPEDGLRHAASSKCFGQGDEPPWDDLIQRMIAKVNSQRETERQHQEAKEWGTKNLRAIQR